MNSNRITSAQRLLYQDLCDGHKILRRGRGSDRVFFAPNPRLFVAWPRAVADGLVKRGLAKWENAAPEDLAQQRLVKV